MKKVLFLLLLIPVFSSCGLLPTEEEAPPPPVIRSYEQGGYKTVAVVRGDIVENVKVSCQYTPAREQSLYFTVAGIPVTAVYVSRGDSVKAGDPLIELDRATVESAISSQQFEISKLSLELKQLKDSYDLEKEGVLLRLAALDRELLSADGEKSGGISAEISSLQGKQDAADAAYKENSDILNIRLRVAGEKLKELEGESAARLLTAPFDGTVTAIKKIESSTLSNENEAFVTISDKSTSVFVVSGDKSKLFKIGDKVDLTLSSTVYSATVVDPAELGTEPDASAAYIALDEYAAEIKDRATGTVTIVLEERQDVLCLPAGAVKSLGGEKIVYYIDEQGIKNYKEISAGFSAGGIVEILSGLDEGDEVVIE
ncbi:MAG: biotin/lipoyl-binding protein [Oscillospiraceae bacterium]|jgi:multidrug efflux pump subunit AcrA (membrane-fusion protein)|nr:biotin/lipoyl-binding protein [Oscillospiraceae bacterium]